MSSFSVVLCSCLTSKNGGDMPADNRRRAWIVLSIIAMIAFGWFGKDSMSFSYAVGFVFFAVAFYLLKQEMVLNVHEEDSLEIISSKQNIKILYFSSLLLWGLYGIVYLLPYTYRNMSYNVLDLFTKGGLALLLYTVFSKRSELCGTSLPGTRYSIKRELQKKDKLESARAEKI